MLLYQ